MREIKFRGLGTNGWEYGYLVREQFRGYDQKHYYQCDNGEFLEYEKIDSTIISYGYKIYRIGNQSAVWVKKETIGQYITISDKEGKEIYEGDIYKQAWNGEIITGVITYDMNRFWIVDSECEHLKYGEIKFTGEIIGNKYENPELLK